MTDPVPYFTDVTVNGRWTLQLPEFRAVRYLKAGPLGWERERLASMRVNLGDNDILLDCGAESGDMTALFAGWVNTVIPMEPNPVAWPNMRAIYEANGLAPPVVHWVGFASDVTSNNPVGSPFGLGWPACADGPLTAAHGFRHLADDTDVAATAQTTIDDFLARPGVPTPTAVTMDVEGAELLALAGARRLLTEHHPLLWVSVHPDQLRFRFGQRPGHVYELLESVGYRVTHLADDHETHIMAEPR